MYFLSVKGQANNLKNNEILNFQKFQFFTIVLHESDSTFGSLRHPNRKARLTLTHYYLLKVIDQSCLQIFQPYMGTIVVLFKRNQSIQPVGLDYASIISAFLFSMAQNKGPEHSKWTIDYTVLVGIFFRLRPNSPSPL